MKRVLIVLSLMTSGVALAEQTEKVSKIDGQIVKVGEKNEYEHDYKKWNIGVNAFLLPANIISISGSYAITENIAGRVGIAHNMHDEKNKTSVNFGVPIYMKKVYSGFFVEPGIDSDAGLYVAGGYHWMWDSGLNTYIGAGIGNKGAMGMLQVAYAFDTPRF